MAMDKLRIDKGFEKEWQKTHNKHVSDFELWAMKEVARQFFGTPHSQSFFCEGMLNLMENGHLKTPNEVLWMTYNGNIVFEVIGDDKNEMYVLRNL